MRPFIVTSTVYGSMIASVNDWKPVGEGQIELGVGAVLLRYGTYDTTASFLMASILAYCRRERGDGVVMIDGGANIGHFSIILARGMVEWGSVLAFEPQERIFYALCGNIAINNAFNVRAFPCALARTDGTTKFPMPDYSLPGNYGGVSVMNRNDIGQKLDRTCSVETKRIDSLDLSRLDLLKLDIEGMEVDALNGALETIARCKPFIFAEYPLAGLENLEKFFCGIGYETVDVGADLLAAYGQNEIIDQIRESKAA